jgi:proteasome lid subunit RPN8/RPN11
VTPVAVRGGVLEAIAAHARREAPRECCGLLVGDADRIDEAVPAANHAADPLRRYQIDPAAFFALAKRVRGTRQSVIGAYHSHPGSAAAPSRTDLAEAFADFYYVIAGPVADDLPVEIRAYGLIGGNFRPIRLVPDAEESSG